MLSREFLPYNVTKDEDSANILYFVEYRIGIRAIASWANCFRQIERTSFRLLGATRTPAFNSPIESDRGQSLSMVNGVSTLKNRPYSHFTGSQTPRKSPTYLTALVAGLFGLGGVTFISNNTSGENTFSSLFPKAYCDCEDECEKRQCDSSDCLRKTECEEEMIKKANAELEKALRDTKGKAVEFTEVALKAYCDAIDAIKSLINKVYCAAEEENLDSPRFEEVWCDIDEAVKKRCELAKLAMEKGQCAWELLRRLREVIENGKACQYTACNPLLVTSEQTLLCAEKELCSRKTIMDSLMKESRVVEQYRNLIEDFRRDLKAEADSLVASEECRVTLTENEANMILTHAYKKILRVQKELSQNGNRC